MQNQKYKILCLVDNSSEHSFGYKAAKEYSEKNKVIFRGLLLHDPKENGCYHVGPLDMAAADIIQLAKSFDKIILLNLPQEKYSHHRIFLAMFKLVNDLRKNDIEVKEENSDNMKYLYDWTTLFEKNKSFCILPWVLYHDSFGGYTSLCGRATDPVTKKDDLKSWKNDKNYVSIRNKLKKGELISNCEACYRYERKGVKDQRWNYSFDWIARMKIKDVQDLEKINSPAYYQIRPSNKCNLKCRMCTDNYSHLIEQERKEIKDKKFHNLVNTQHFKMKTDFDVVELDNLKELYVAGGEPTVMPELYRFMEKCVKKNKTNFDFCIQTNTAVLKDKFFDLCKHFEKLSISTSVDGVDKVNEYIRWGVNSKIQNDNINRLYMQGINVHLISVVSIYNVDTLGETLTFFDKQFPYAPVQLQCAEFRKNILDPYNHPDRERVLESLIRAKKTKCYWHNESGTTNLIDSLYNTYSKTDKSFDKQKLRDFFYYNDTLDKHRGSNLVHYIPKLEECRKYITEH